MRVVVYVPVSLSASRTRRAVERDVTRQGHEVVGYVKTFAEVRAAIRGGVAELVAGRPEHLAAMVPQFLPVPVARGRIAAVVVLALAAWWVAHRRPAVVTGALTVLAAVAALALLDGGEPPAGPDAERTWPPASPAAPTPTVETPPLVTRDPIAVAPPLLDVPTQTPESTTAPPTTIAPTTTTTAPTTTAPPCRLAVDVDALTVAIEVCVTQPNG